MNKIVLQGARLILTVVLAFGAFIPGGATSQASALTSNERVTLASSKASAETIYNDKDPAIKYSSGWKNVNEKNAYNGSFKLTQKVNSHATLNFNGESFSIIYKTGPLFGNMDVYVDGTLVGTIDQKTSAPTFQQKWTYGGALTPGTHTLKLVFASPSDARVSVDAISILTSSVVETPVQPPASIETATVLPTQTVPPTVLPANTATQTPVPTLIAPTTTVPTQTAPTTAVPTNAVTATATSTQVPVQPSATATLQPTNSVPQSTGSGLLISSEELMSLPTSGTAWDKLRTTAYGTWGTADLKNQDNKHAINTLAGALVYARTGDASLRIKVKDQILAAKRTLDESSEWQTTNGVLAAGRQLGAYVISADLIGLKNFDPTVENEFRNWLTTIRTTNIGTHGRWKSIVYTCENAAANWSTFACASRIAASLYLGDTADTQRSAFIIRAFLGERSYYPANAPGSNGYFQHTASYQSSWACNDPVWVAINPPCVKSGVNIDGALVEDASRGGGCCVLQSSGTSYSWEALQGLFVSAELLYRAGSYGDPYSWSNQALKRAMDFMQRSGWGITGPSTYVPWMANYRYNTSYLAASVSGGRIMSWGDWLYQ